MFGLVSLAFQSGCWAMVVRFSLLVGEGLFVPAATWGFAFSFVGFALTAIGSFVLVGNGMGYQNISSLSRTNAFSIMVLPSQFGEMDLHQRNWNNSRGQR